MRPPIASTSRLAIRCSTGKVGAKATSSTSSIKMERPHSPIANEDVAEHPRILDRGSYHVVVGNPPYITVKDKALNELYRASYKTCKGKYALSVPFMELFFELAKRGDSTSPAGYVGQITSNSFMKREFGAKIIEGLLSGKDLANPVELTNVIDTSGAYVPGHGTPTVILVGRRRRPVGKTLRAVLGVRGEPGQPQDPSHGLVWTEIVGHFDDSRYDGNYVTITDLDRSCTGGTSVVVERRRRQRSHGRTGQVVDSNAKGRGFPHRGIWNHGV